MLSDKSIKSRELGQKAEAAAERYLIKQGLKLKTRNFNCRVGEIDLVMQEKEFIVFVEVRFRQSSHFGGALESITYNKQQRLIRAANYYINKYQCYHHNARFDVVAIDKIHPNLVLSWVKNAFTE